MVRLATNVLFAGISGCCHVSIATMAVTGKEDAFRREASPFLNTPH